MSIKKYHKSANLFDGLLIGGYFINADFDTAGNNDIYKSIKVFLPAGTYTFSWGKNVNVTRTVIDGNHQTQPSGSTNITSYTITSTTDGYVGISFRDATSASIVWDVATPIMLNSGSSALPYEPYDPEVWHSVPYRKYGTETDTITTLPATVIGDGTPISSYTIKGNTERSGTPTPENPIMPIGCGEKTENLWDEKYGTITANITYVPIYVGSGDFTLSTTAPLVNDTSPLLYLLAGNVSGGASPYNNAYTGNPRTQTSVDGYITVAYRKVSTYTPDMYNTMLNLGSTPLPYEPYGYKLPILSNSTVTNIYLGEVPTARKIKKLVLTEKEVSTVDASSKQAVIPLPDRCLGVAPLCSHYIGKITSAWSTIRNGEIAVLQQGSATARICDTTYATTASNYNNYLAQQYANGTPVTIWYVLAEPETGIVNKPLMKIGDYADSVSGTNLATSGTAQELGVCTTLKPSEIDLTYHGWHEHEDTKFTT